MHRSPLWALAAFLLVCLGSIAVGGWLRAVYAPEWLAPDTTQHPPAIRPWAVEADCYSQLARVQRILRGQGLIQNHFKVENWPEGLVPSTTAPFDYAILLLYFPLTFFTHHPLDWAGALVSPVLWLGLVCFWIFFRSREFNLTGRALFLLGSAALPAFIWATACGRPRHQSLILALMAMGLTAEYERWHLELTPKRAWNIFAGLVWGLACWTSLFEPAVVVVVLVLFNLVARRREYASFLITFGLVILAMFFVEGSHIFDNVFNIYNLTPDNRQYALNWLGTIAEVRGISLAAFLGQITLLSFVFLVPFLAWRLWRRGGDGKADRLLILLTCLLTVLAFVQQRWIYYASLAELFLLVRYCQAAPWRWARLAVMALFLLGLVYDNTQQMQRHAAAPANQPSLQLAEISRSINGAGGILAPWWLSPGLLYFSGQPIVSGSSHGGISGIVASAKFYTATSWPDAERILRERRVRWIVVWDDPLYVYPLLNSSCGILGQPAYTDDTANAADATVAQILISDQLLPTSLHLRGVTQNLKLYEYVPDVR